MKKQSKNKKINKILLDFLKKEDRLSQFLSIKKQRDLKFGGDNTVCALTTLKLLNKFELHIKKQKDILLTKKERVAILKKAFTIQRNSLITLNREYAADIIRKNLDSLGLIVGYNFNMYFKHITDKEAELLDNSNEENRVKILKLVLEKEQELPGTIERNGVALRKVEWSNCKNCVFNNLADKCERYNKTHKETCANNKMYVYD